MQISLEDLRPAICDDFVASLVREASDELDFDIAILIFSIEINDESPPADSSAEAPSPNVSAPSSVAFKSLNLTSVAALTTR